MKQVLIFIFFAAFLSFGMTSCGDEAAKATGSTNEGAHAEDVAIAKDLETAVFKQMMSDGKFEAIDVRAPKERLSDNIYTKVGKPYGFIPGTPHNFNWKDGADFKAGLAKLDKSKAYGVYCGSGNRSGKAMAAMHKMGFKEVYNLAGGMKGWHQAGNAVEVVEK